MKNLLIGSVLEIGERIIDRFIPNETEANRAKFELVRESKTQEFQTLMGQLEVNAKEAQSGSMWVAGWRPFIGWICGASLGLIYIPKALVLTGIWTYQSVVIIGAWNGIGTPPTMPEYPDLGVSDLIGLLLSMLGIAAFRTQEKLHGKDTKGVL